MMKPLRPLHDRAGFPAWRRRGSLGGGQGQGVRVLLDDPAVLAEVRAVFDRYEAALMANETAVLDQIFWADPRTVRFGIAEVLYGHEAIRAFRASVKAYAQRVQKHVHIVAFGGDFAATHLEYERIGTGLIGRETKIMARLPEGWRVVSAHVSLLGQGAQGGDPGREMRK
jgi:hypothetical protein